MAKEYKTIKSILLSKKTILCFDNYYKDRIRIYSHILFWVFLLILYMAQMWILDKEYPYSLNFVITFRQIVQSVFFFYFTTYFIIPKLFLRKKFVATAICLAIPFLLEPFINFIIFHLFNRLLIQEKASEMEISRALFNAEISDVLKAENIVYSITPTLLRTLPAFMMKLLVSVIHVFSKDEERKAEQHALEMQNMQMEVNLLKSQMNPEYLFNTLHNIYSFATNKDERAPDMIADLSEILQYTLYESKNAQVFLESELNLIRKYLAMERLNHKEKNTRIEFDNHIPNAAAIRVAPLILFPFIENAAKYGLSGSTANGYIKVKLETHGEELIFEVENSKSTEPVKAHQTNIGHISAFSINNTKKRLRMLYPGSQLIIEESADTYRILLKIGYLKKVVPPYDSETSSE